MKTKENNMKKFDYRPLVRVPKRQKRQKTGDNEKIQLILMMLLL